MLHKLKHLFWEKTISEIDDNRNKENSGLANLINTLQNVHHTRYQKPQIKLTHI